MKETLTEYLNKVFHNRNIKMELILPQIIGLKEMEELRKKQNDKTTDSK